MTELPGRQPDFYISDPLALPQSQETHGYEVEVTVWDENTDEPILKGKTIYTGRIKSVKEWIRERIFIDCTADHLLYRIKQEQEPKCPYCGDTGYVMVKGPEDTYISFESENCSHCNERDWLLDETEDNKKREATARHLAEQEAEDAALSEAELHWKYDGPKGL